MEFIVHLRGPANYCLRTSQHTKANNISQEVEQRFIEEHLTITPVFELLARFQWLSIHYSANRQNSQNDLEAYPAQEDESSIFVKVGIQGAGDSRQL